MNLISRGYVHEWRLKVYVDLSLNKNVKDYLVATATDNNCRIRSRSPVCVGEFEQTRVQRYRTPVTATSIVSEMFKVQNVIRSLYSRTKLAKEDSALKVPTTDGADDY